MYWRVTLSTVWFIVFCTVLLDVSDYSIILFRRSRITFLRDHLACIIARWQWPMERHAFSRCQFPDCVVNILLQRCPATCHQMLVSPPVGSHSHLSGDSHLASVRQHLISRDPGIKRFNIFYLIRVRVYQEHVWLYVGEFWTSGQWMTERAGGSDVSRGNDISTICFFARQ